MGNSRLLILGITFAVGLAWMALEWFREPPSVQDPPPQEAREPAPINLPAEYVGDIDAFREIAERPLFVEGRQPPSPAEIENASPTAQIQARAPAAVQNLSNLRLSAVINDAGKRIALVESNDGSIERIEVGSRLYNWKVDSIRDDAVVLKAGTTEKVLEVYRFDAVPVRQPPRRRARLVRNPNRPSVVPGNPEEAEGLDVEPEEFDPNDPEAD